MNRAGTTLVELLMGLVLLALLGIAITETLMATSRATAHSIQALTVARTMVATNALVREELGHSDAGEMRLSGPTAVDFGRTIGVAAVCDVQGSIVRLPIAEWLGARWPEGGRDEAVLLTDPSSGHWAEIPIVAVSGGRCPDGADALLLTMSSAPAAAVFARITEPVQLRGYVSGGSGWWGLAPADGLSPVQPFAGPLDTPLQAMTLTGRGLVLSFMPLHGPAAELVIPLGPP